MTYFYKITKAKKFSVNLNMTSSIILTMHSLIKKKCLLCLNDTHHSISKYCLSCADVIITIINPLLLCQLRSRLCTLSMNIEQCYYNRAKWRSSYFNKQNLKLKNKLERNENTWVNEHWTSDYSDLFTINEKFRRKIFRRWIWYLIES